MRKILIVCIIITGLATQAATAQYNADTTAVKDKDNNERRDVYRLKNAIDLPIAALGVGGTLYGFHLRESKENSDSMAIVNLSTASLSKWDKRAATQNNEGVNMASDLIFAGGFVVPWMLYADKHVRSEAYEYSVMYLEALGITGMGYAMAAGLVHKYRPYAYNPDVEHSRRASKHSTNSFYAGHVAVTAAGTFFAAKTFSDFHPDSKFRYVAWGVAGGATAAQCILRYKGGYHFPSDIAIGAALGTATGILVPVLHKNMKGSAISMSPYFGEGKGITLRYTFREKKTFNSLQE